MISKNETNGFTLIELSIVLVIIGLLIGGILAAQSMIQTSKTQSFVRQIQQYDITISNFKNLYNQLPGDSTFFSPAGNGDGLITSVDPSATYLSVYNQANDLNYEIAGFWPQLFQSGMISNKYQVLSDASCPSPTDITAPVGTYFPKAGIGANNTGILVMSDRGGVFYNYTVYHLAYIKNQCMHGVGGPTVGAFTSLSVAETAAVDIKMDDGQANTGNIKAVGNGNAGGDPSFGSTGCLVDTVGYAYNFNSSSSTPCSLDMKILSQAISN